MSRKWQYKVATIKVSSFSKLEKRDQQLEEALNRFALEGWELLSVTQAYGAHPRLYMRKHLG